MWIGKGLIVGIVASLLVGGLVLAVDPEMASSGPALDGSPMTIPVGRVGDRVTYAVFERDGGHDAWKRSADRGFSVKEIVEAPDVHGVAHRSVVVLTTPHEGRGYLGMAYPDVQKAGVVQTKTYRIDLATRAYVSRTYEYSSNPEAGLLGTYQQVGANTAYGPAEWGVVREGMYKDFPGERHGHSQFSPLVYQGRTVQLGGDLGPLEDAVLASEANNIAFEGSIAVPEFTYEAGIVDRRRVGDHDAYNARTKGCLVFVNPPGSWTAAKDSGFESATGFLHAEVPYDKEICFEVDTWLTADIPYPILIETRIRVAGTELPSRLESLAAYAPGTEPIPWENGPANFGGHRFPPETWDRSGPVHYPAEGKESRLVFGLSEALGLVESSPLLPDYRAWKATHPRQELIGYQLTPREHGLLRWTLVFGEPDGALYVLSVQKVPGQPAEPPREIGEHRGKPFDLEGWHDDPTIAQADKVWQAALNPSQAPNWVRWGYEFIPTTVSCVQAPACTKAEGSIREWDPSFVLVGFTSQRFSSGPADVRVTPAAQGRDDSYAVVWSPTLALFISGHAQEYGRFNALVGDGAPVTGTSGPATQGWAIPKIGPAAWVSSGFLAVFLAVYFFPVLKQIGLEVALAIPGYAKLHKKELLNNAYRDRITGLVRQEPGITGPELKTAVGGSLSTVVYHLRVLERNKLVSSMIDGRHRRFFPTEQVSWGERGRLAALRNAKTRELYQIIHDEPGIAPKDLSGRVGLSRPTVYWHVDRLVRVGLVGHDRERGRARFYAADPDFRTPVLDRRDMEVA